MIYRLEDLIIKYDKNRKPLSTMVRNKMEKNFPYYGANGIIDYVDNYIFDGNYILMAEDGTVLYNDKYPVLYRVSGKFWVSNHAHVFQSRGDIVNQDYLFYALKNTPILDKITGSTQLKLSQENMNGILIYVPDMNTQLRIVKILNTINDKIDSCNKENDLLLNQLKNYYNMHFINNDNSLKQVSSYVSETIGGDWGKETAQGNFIEEVLCVRGADIPEFVYGKCGKAPNRFILTKNYEKKKLTSDSIIIEISGGSPTQSTGRCAFVSKELINRFELPLICTNFCRALKFKEKKYSAYIYTYMQCMYDKGLFFTYENGTTGIKNLDLNAFLDSEKIHDPSNDELDKFNSLFSVINKKMINNALIIDKLNEALEIILPRLMDEKKND